MQLSALIPVVVAVFIFMNVFFILSLITKRTHIVDVAWGLGFIVITLLTLSLYGVRSQASLLISTLVLVWGVRLASHLAMRNRGKNEDFRYAEWKKGWGKLWVIQSYLKVFILQGAVMILVALPIIFTNSAPVPTNPIPVFTRVGALMWLVGFYFEAIGDWQLMKFKSKPQNNGKVMDQGLWRYTRHPNYFGEAMMWWGIYVIALTNIAAWYTFIGPLFITFSLLKISGVTLLEKKYKGNPEYQAYQKKTSSFVPWWPQN